MMKTPKSEATFVKGAPLSPKDGLVTWMDSQLFDGKPRLLRLVIVLPKGQLGYEIDKARVGTATDALVVVANDAALGVGLADRAADKCDGTDAPTCAFRVEGYWRGKKTAGLQFDVNKAEYLAPDQAAAITHAEVEGESGN